MRLLGQVLLRKRRGDARRVDKQKPVADCLQLRRVVAGKEDRFAVLRNRADVGAQRGGITGPQPLGGLVQKHRSGIPNQRLRHSHAAALVGAQPAKHGIAQVVQFQLFENGMNLARRPGAALAAQLGNKTHQPPDRHAVIKFRVGCGIADAFADRDRLKGGVKAADPDRACGGQCSTGKHGKQRRRGAVSRVEQPVDPAVHQAQVCRRNVRIPREAELDGFNQFCILLL